MLARIKRIVRKTLDAIDAVAMRVCVAVPYLSNVYYCVSRRFEREHHAVLTGRLAYAKSLSGGDRRGHVYRLRRNTHRLEKGLIMRPRREVFARDYLAETIDSFIALYTETAEKDELYSWSSSVLGSYFEAVLPGADATADRCRERFLKATQPAELTLTHSPFERDTAPLDTTIEGLLELAKRRRSVRWYDQRPVPRELIDKAVVIAGYSPSACNRQPFEFRFFDDPKLIKELAPIPMGTTGFNHQFPMFGVIVGKLHAYPLERDRHVIYIDASLAAMALEFALEVQGIASCSINWPDIPALEKRMGEKLGLSADERVIMCLSLGYPDTKGLVPYSQKKSLDELRSYNRTGER